MGYVLFYYRFSNYVSDLRRKQPSICCYGHLSPSDLSEVFLVHLPRILTLTYVSTCHMSPNLDDAYVTLVSHEDALGSSSPSYGLSSSKPPIFHSYMKWGTKGFLSNKQEPLPLQSLYIPKVYAYD